MKLTRDDLNSVNNNVMTIMESRVMSLVECDKRTANNVSNIILELDRDAQNILKEIEIEKKLIKKLITKVSEIKEKMLYCGFYEMYGILDGNNFDENLFDFNSGVMVGTIFKDKYELQDSFDLYDDMNGCILYEQEPLSFYKNLLKK